MSNNLSTPQKLAFLPIDTALYSTGVGATEWEDKDVSATTGTDTRKLWVVTIYAANALSGIRAHGEVKQPIGAGYLTWTAFTYVDSSGHVDLYHVVTQADYRFIGYFV